MLDLQLLETSCGGLFRGNHLLLKAELAAHDADLPMAEIVGFMVAGSPELIPADVALEVREESGKRIYLLTDARGRPAESFADARHLARTEQGSREEEFFYSDGTIFDLPATLESFPQDADELTGNPFSYGINTRFSEFSPNGHILHHLRPWGTANMQEVLPHLSPRAILRLLPLRLERVRLGFERYRRRFLGAMLGIIPSIESRFYFEMTDRRIFLLLEQENAKKGQRLPLEDCPLVCALEQALDRSGLFPGLREELAVRFCKAI